MARGKKGRKTAPNVPANQETQPKKQKKELVQSKNRFSILDYVIVCVFFIAFCYLQKFLALKLLDDASVERWSLDFFFDTLWKGFIVVAILVAIHDYFFQDTEEDIP